MRSWIALGLYAAVSAVTATITVQPQPGIAWAGRPVLVFNGETGGGIRAAWETLEPLKNCELEDDRLLLAAGKRQAVFRGVTDASTHPVAAREASVSVDFRAAERIEQRSA